MTNTKYGTTEKKSNSIPKTRSTSAIHTTQKQGYHSTYSDIHLSPTGSMTLPNEIALDNIVKANESLDWALQNNDVEMLGVTAESMYFDIMEIMENVKGTPLEAELMGQEIPKRLQEIATLAPTVESVNEQQIGILKDIINSVQNIMNQPPEPTMSPMEQMSSPISDNNNENPSSNNLITNENKKIDQESIFDTMY